MIAGNRILQLGGAGKTYLNVAGANYGTGQLSVSGNVIRGNGTGVGLNYQRGAHNLTITSDANLVTDVTTVRRVGGGVLLNAGA